MTARPVGGMRKHPLGRVDQLEDRYLGMVEAPSSNLGTSTLQTTDIFANPFVNLQDDTTSNRRLDKSIHSHFDRSDQGYFRSMEEVR